MKNQNQSSYSTSLIAVLGLVGASSLIGCETVSEDHSPPVYCLNASQQAQNSSLTVSCFPPESEVSLTRGPILFQEQWVEENRQWVFWNVGSGLHRIRVGETSVFEVGHQQVLVLNSSQIPNDASSPVTVWSESLGIKLGEILFEAHPEFPRRVRGRAFTGTLRDLGGDLRARDTDFIHPTVVPARGSFWIWAQSNFEPLYPDVGDFEVLQVRRRRGSGGKSWVGLELKLKPIIDSYPPAGRFMFGPVDRVLVLKQE